ncbi:hypothetical protein [Haloferula sargassicola]|uniref:Group II intron maturase-specific domain-containing protein n=1 Tax=Haloferula sargassicola TaxID=490096 RepID=A0ABP9UHW8_9BACT
MGLKASRSVPLRDQVVTLSRKLQGHWNDFGVIGNSVRLWQLLHHVRRLAFKWWNRRSQRRSFTWAEFAEAWERWKMPRPKILETPWP